MIPALFCQVQIRQFYVQNSVCWCLPKSISNRRYSNIIVPAHPWKPRFSNVLCKTRCFDAFPKTLQITYSNILFLPAPHSADSPIFSFKTGCFEVFPEVFWIESIQIYYYCITPGSPGIHQFYVQNWLYWGFPRGISNKHIFKLLSFSRDREVRAWSENVFDNWMYVFS